MMSGTNDERIAMVELQADLRLLIASQENTSKQVAEMSDSLKQLTEISIRREERDRQQDEINNKNAELFNEVFNRLRNIEMNRAKEQPAREFLIKYWPWLAVACVVGGGALTYMLPRILMHYTV